MSVSAAEGEIGEFEKRVISRTLIENIFHPSIVNKQTPNIGPQLQTLANISVLLIYFHFL